MISGLKKWTALMLCGAMLAGTLAGCNNGGTPAPSATPSPEQTQGQEPADNKDNEEDNGGEGSTTTSTLFDETFEFTIMGSIWEPHSQDEMTIFNEIMSRTNTKLNFKWFPQDGFQDKVNTMLASNDIPEMIISSTLATLIDQGAILPLDEYLESDGQNILASCGESISLLRQPLDGKIYSIPFVLDYPPAYAMLIRQDWLDNVGIEKLPETWEEWVAVWTAFKEQDANGDGDATNEIPLGGDLYSLMPAFGINASAKTAFTLDAEGNYTIAYELPQFRAFLEAARELYAQGLIDPEFSTRGTYVNGKEMENALFSDIVGSAFSWAEIAKRTTETVREVSPNAKMVGVAPITGPDGSRGIPSRTPVANKGSITITAEQNGKAADIVKFFNWVFGEEGAMLSSFGIEGTHYTVEDGQPVLQEPYSNSFVDARKAGLNFTPWPHLFMPEAYEQILLSGKTYEESPETTKLFYDALHVGEDSFFTAIPALVTESYSTKQAQVMPKLESLLAECVIGKITVDEFYTEYEKLKPLGLQDILDEGKEAWAMMNN